MKYIGLDLGSRTLGVALSDNTGLIASSYKTIRHNEDYDSLIEEVKKIAGEVNATGIVLGMPKNMNNTIGPKGELSLAFKEKLEKAISIPVYLQDERLTTKSATDMLIMGNVSRKNRKKVVDSVAATIILQTFLDKKGKENERK
ncbi:MAG: Holliday junction resolvase RuvX [bacterium]|nr:Holliday junction resolvase RuvX [bacterium]